MRIRDLWEDVRGAFGLFTRLPLPMPEGPPKGAATAWAWPLVGAGVGALAALAAALVQGIGVPAGIAAGIALAAQAMLTGAMHEDGLADTADGLWGGWDKARRLAIMKDSHIGSYGVLALLLVTLMRWSALSTLISADAGLPVLIAVGALSRVPMVAIMAALPNARGTGLAQAVGRPSAQHALIATGLGLALALPFAGAASLGAAVAVAAVSLGLALTARAKIGGQTGDILGASQQLADLAALAMLAATI